jgi:glycosyltransferase involved in cell wall biosynthesis
MTISAPLDDVDVTVIVTSYNHQAYIEQCLASILSQDRAPKAVVVIDDASTDDSADVIEQWIRGHGAPFRFIRHTTNRGVCKSLNEALSEVKSAYFCHISGDDWIPVDRIRVQSDALADAPEESAAVVGDVEEVDAGGINLATHDIGARLMGLLGPDNQIALHDALLRENVILAPAVMLRTSAVRAIGGFDETLAFEDYDMWLRLSHRFSFAYAPGVVSHYRVLGSSLTRNPRRAREMLDSQVRLLRKHLGESPENDIVISDHLNDIAKAAENITSGGDPTKGGQARRSVRRRRGRPEHRSSTVRSVN